MHRASGRCAAAGQEHPQLSDLSLPGLGRFGLWALRVLGFKGFRAHGISSHGTRALLGFMVLGSRVRV